MAELPSLLFSRLMTSVARVPIRSGEYRETLTNSLPLRVPPVIILMDYRSILEVAKLSCPRDALQSFSLVSTEWLHVSDSKELWSTYADIRGFPPPPSVLTSLKDWFFLLHQRFGSIPLVRSHELALFNCKRGRWDKKIRLKKSIKADEVSASTMLPDGSLLCCGGGNWKTSSNWASAYRITDEGSVQTLQDMQVAREAHGIICFQNVVYVFGGDTDAGPPVMSGEKFPLLNVSSLVTQDWTLLPNMLFGHSYFTPVLFQQLFYLCGGYSQNSETFNPANELFSPVSLALTDPEHNWCAVYQNQLIIVSGYRMHVFDKSDDRSRNKRLKRLPHYVLDEWSQTPPLVIGDTAYRLALNGDVLETNLSTQDEARVKHPRT